jgi:2,4-dichlorophenol 6-monooxygenase
MGGIYTPTTRPGHRLPHAWIESAERGRISTHDLTSQQPSFILITGDAGSPWHDVAARVGKELGVGVVPVSIGEHGDYRDVEGQWSAVREISDEGAILVRPDNHVAWRSHGAAADPQSELTSALSRVLRV